MTKTCSCGKRYSSGTWKLLPYVGVHDDGVERLELRNCVCGSTIAIELGPSRTSSRPPIAP